MTETAQPLGPWQDPSASLRECKRHSNLCAYRAGDSSVRCDRCHRPWRVITGQDDETREHHEQKHDKDDAIRAKKRAKELTA